MDKLYLWWRRRRFEWAYTILRQEADIHKNAEHNMHFHATSPASIEMHCYACPETFPLP